ncbi:MAG: hypothetical protein L3J08_04325 [Flavobacteriaceae bacterium]|nr:hypothetical protein [Flavobacteriaceae bacterium]
MYTRRNYSIKDMMKWTRRDTFVFIIIALVPVLLYSVLGQKWLHLPWLPISLIGTAVAFLVSFKNNASYDRLWEARKIWGGIVNTSRSFAMLTNTYISNKNAPNISDKELQTIKKTIINRHIAWMTVHRYTLRQTKPWEMFLKKVSDKEFSKLYDVQEWKHPMDKIIKPYLSEKEYAIIQGKQSQASQLLSLQSIHLKELKEQGLIWEFSYLEIKQLLVELFTLQGKNERIKNFPYPRQYATINLFFVWIFVLLLPFGIMNEFNTIGLELLKDINEESTGFLNQSYAFIATHFVWLSVPFSVLISWVFHTMERMGEVSENPFEGTANDVPITTMSRGIEIDILEIIGESDVPEPIPSLYDVQM